MKRCQDFGVMTQNLIRGELLLSEIIHFKPPNCPWMHLNVTFSSVILCMWIIWTPPPAFPCFPPDTPTPSYRVIIHIKAWKLASISISGYISTVCISLTEIWTWGWVHYAVMIYYGLIHLHNGPSRGRLTSSGCWHVSSSQCQTQDVHFMSMKMVTTLST